MTQEGDVRIFQTDNDGDISVVGGIVGTDGGLESSVYLSIFGGNEEDDGLDGNLSTWWGNLSEGEADLKYRSRTQNLLRSLPLTSKNLKRVEDAVNQDLAWMAPQGAASLVEVSVSVQGLNTLYIQVIVEAAGETSEFAFYENWKAAV